MTISSIAIISLAVASEAKIEEAILIDAFAVRESSRRTDIRGDEGRSWGLFQFTRERWSDVGGDPADWGVAGARVQVEVMRKALAWYRDRAAARGVTLDTMEKRAIWYARWHNIGHAHRGDESRPTTYSRKLIRDVHAIEASDPEKRIEDAAETAGRRAILQDASGSRLLRVVHGADRAVARSA